MKVNLKFYRNFIGVRDARLKNNSNLFITSELKTWTKYSI